MLKPSKLPPELQEKALRLRDDLAFFSRNCLVLRDRAGTVRPFHMNRAQIYLHDRLEKQRQDKGHVRAIVVKGRQLGISTYLQGRNYHRLWAAKKALQAFILTHEQAATDNLFGMTQRFHDNMPPPVKPKTKAANAKELVFADTDCGYHVATAGTRSVGRSSTIQLFHGSEVAYWPNAEDHIGGVMQTVVTGHDTEIVLESTANGVGNVYHRMAMAAARGESEYEAVFIPWFWGEDYVEDCPADWQPSEEWLEYARINGLHWEQLYWAYLKNRSVAQALSLPDTQPCWKFKAEYPATMDEAFQTSSASFIPGGSVMRARRPEAKIIGHGPVILGIDPARSGDKVGVIDRCGRRMGERVCLRLDPGGNSVHLAQQLSKIIDRIKPDVVNIDVGSDGGPVHDMLAEMGHSRVLVAVNFGGRPIGQGPTGDRMYANRRAEMYDELREWLETEGGVQVPDDDGLHADLTAAEWGPGATRYNTSNQLILEEKDKIKARLGGSPDLGDAAALTFATPLASGMGAMQQPAPVRRRNRRSGY